MGRGFQSFTNKEGFSKLISSWSGPRAMEGRTYSRASSSERTQPKWETSVALKSLCQSVLEPISFGQAMGPNVCLKSCACQSYLHQGEWMGSGLEGGMWSSGGAGEGLWLVSEGHTAFSSPCPSVPVSAPPLTCASSWAPLVCCREPFSPPCWPPGTSPVGGGARVPSTSYTGLLDAITLLGTWVSPETELQRTP